MCLLAILYHVVDGCPVVVAANREENYDRVGTPPELWSGSPNVLAGKDPRAGGTWLGVNEHGLLVAVTNRPSPQPTHVRSRGLLCRDLLACRSAKSARDDALSALSGRQYAGCNLLMIDPTQAYVIHSSEKLEARPLEHGIHALSQGDLNQPSDRRISRALQQLTSRQHNSPILDRRHDNRSDATPIRYWLAVLRDLCKDHGDDEQPAICLHQADRGTVSSSLIALADAPVDSVFLHAQGPACQVNFADYSHLLMGVLQAHSRGLDSTAISASATRSINA